MIQSFRCCSCFWIVIPCLCHDRTGTQLHSESSDILAWGGTSWWENFQYRYALEMILLFDTKLPARESRASYNVNVSAFGICSSRLESEQVGNREEAERFSAYRSTQINVRFNFWVILNECSRSTYEVRDRRSI